MSLYIFSPLVTKHKPSLTLSVSRLFQSCKGTIVGANHWRKAEGTS